MSGVRPVPFQPMIIPNTELKFALAGLGKVINRPTLPILGMIRLDRAANGSVELTGTNLDCHATVRLKVVCPGEPTSFLIPYQALLKLVRSCERNDSFQFEPISTKRLRLFVHSAGHEGLGSDHRFDTEPLDMFPKTPTVSGNAIPLPDAFGANLQLAMQSASRDSTRYVINSALIDVSNRKCHHLVATDGQHLFSSNSFTLPIKHSLIIPTHRFLAWPVFAEDGAWQLSVDDSKRKGDRFMCLQSDHWRVICKTISGNYPDWRRVIPGEDQYKTGVEFISEELRDVIAAIEEMPDCDEKHHRVGIEVKRCNVRLLSQECVGGRLLTKEINTRAVSGLDVKVYVNRHYLLRALRSGLHHLQIIGTEEPMRLHDEAGRQMIVMPVRYDDSPSRNRKPRIRLPDRLATASPIPEEAPQPVSVTQVAEQETQPEQTMEKTNEKPALLAALDQIEVIKGSLRGGMAGLNNLSDLLRLAARDSKTTEREVRTVRDTLASLQKLKI